MFYYVYVECSVKSTRTWARTGPWGRINTPDVVLYRVGQNRTGSEVHISLCDDVERRTISNCLVFVVHLLRVCATYGAACLSVCLSHARSNSRQLNVRAITYFRQPSSPPARPGDCFYTTNATPVRVLSDVSSEVCVFVVRRRSIGLYRRYWLWSAWILCSMVELSSGQVFSLLVAITLGIIKYQFLASQTPIIAIWPRICIDKYICCCREAARCKT